MKNCTEKQDSGSQFLLRTTTAIQLGPDTFDESRCIMTFLTILGVAEILCSFKLVLESKAGKGYLSVQDQSSDTIF